MGLSQMDGNRFKKMVMKATGTKGYMSGSVKNSLRDQKANKYLKSGTKISKRKATKIMRQLKDEGLAGKMGMNATKYVKKAYAKESRRKESIKKQNIADRNKEISEEKKAEGMKQAGSKTGSKTGGTAKNSAGSSMQRAPIQTNTATVASANAHDDSFTGSNFGSTNLKKNVELPKAPEKPKEWIEEEENLIDMAID